MNTKTTDKILGLLWMAICGYFFASLVRGLLEQLTAQPFWMCLRLFFVALHLAGLVASFYLLIGAGWPRVVLGLVALLTVTASVLGFFAWFNAPPFSVVGIVFDLFAVASAGFWLLARRPAVGLTGP